MFFQKRCKQCEGYQAEIERLRSQLHKSRTEVERLTQLLDGSPAMPINKPVIEQQSVKKLQSEGSGFYDKSVNWEKLPLQEIERKIGDIHTKFGRNRDTIRAINELQAIQWKIIERQKASKPIAGTNAKRSKITTSELNKTLRKIVGESNKRLVKLWKEMEKELARAPSYNEFMPVMLRKIESKGDKFKSLAQDPRVTKRFYHFEMPRLIKEVDKLDNEWLDFKPVLQKALDQNTSAFMRNMRSSYIVDEYGVVVKDDRNNEIDRLVNSIRGERPNFELKPKIRQFTKQWYSTKKREFGKSEEAPSDGIDFEHWVADALKRYDWQARATQGSGDQGVDVVATKNGVSLGIQCKRYTGSVGNKAIQEAYSGMKHFGLDKAAVLTNAKFTKSAKELAASTGVLLLSPEDIPTLSERPELGI